MRGDMNAARSPSLTDDDLFASAIEGDEAAFISLVRKHEQHLKAFCTCVMGDETLGTDVTQSVFMKVWETRARYQSQGKFKEWLLTIARNQCRSHYRQVWLRRLVSFDVVLHGNELPTQSAEPLAIEAQRDWLLRQALQTLPERFRVPLTLRFMEELEYDEIARVIGRTESAARSRVHYGLKQLALQLPKEFRDELP